MSLIHDIDSQLKESLRAKDSERVALLRLLKNACKRAALDAHIAEEDLDDDAVITVIRQEVKKRKESIAAYEKGDRKDLAEKEQSELSMLQEYLPAELSDEALLGAVQKVIDEQSLESPYVFGTLMSAVMKAVAGQADGSRVKAIVEKYIQESSD